MKEGKEVSKQLRRLSVDKIKPVEKSANSDIDSSSKSKPKSKEIIVPVLINKVPDKAVKVLSKSLSDSEQNPIKKKKKLLDTPKEEMQKEVESS
jgi:hypothetical protein